MSAEPGHRSTKENSMKPAISLALPTLLLAASLAACGADEPAVCSSVDSLKSSAGDIKDVDVGSSSALSDLQTGLKAVEGDLADVKADAKAEFATQISAVETSYATLRTSVKAATAGPTAATLAAAGTALPAFGGDVQTLISDVQSTC
jgi:hypothetical protein